MTLIVDPTERFEINNEDQDFKIKRIRKTPIKKVAETIISDSLGILLMEGKKMRSKVKCYFHPD